MTPRHDQNEEHVLVLTDSLQIYRGEHLCLAHVSLFKDGNCCYELPYVRLRMVLVGGRVMAKHIGVLRPQFCLVSKSLQICWTAVVKTPT